MRSRELDLQDDLTALGSSPDGHCLKRKRTAQQLATRADAGHGLTHPAAIESAVSSHARITAAVATMPAAAVVFLPALPGTCSAAPLDATAREEAAEDDEAAVSDSPSASLLYHRALLTGPSRQPPSLLPESILQAICQSSQHASDCYAIVPYQPSLARSLATSSPCMHASHDASSSDEDSAIEVYSEGGEAMSTL